MCGGHEKHTTPTFSSSSTIKNRKLHYNVHYSHDIISNCSFLNQWYNIDKSNEIGKGGFGSVFLAKDKESHTELAIKIIDPDLDGFIDKIQEITILSKLKHPHIVEIKDCFFDSKANHAIIVMEKAKMSLSDLFKKLNNKAFEKEYLLQIFADILSGLAFAHTSQNISHSDIKPANVLIFTDIDRKLYKEAQNIIVKEPTHIFKLADWGGGKLATKNNINKTLTWKTGVAYTEAYAAPEVIQQEDNEGKINLSKADIYSLGECILSCCGIPSQDFKALNNMTKKPKHQIELESLMQESAISKNYGSKFSDLLKNMMNYEASMRPEISKIFEDLKEIVHSDTDHHHENYVKGSKINEEEKDDKIEAEKIFLLANCYDNGTKYEKNDEKAVELYQKAANLGHSRAMCNLGYCYKNGIGCEKNQKKAIELYEKAAILGNPQAMCNMGFCFKDGTGCEKNMKKAVEFYEKAANLGHSEALYNLGICYDNGLGCGKNLKKAVELYEKASNIGNSDAMFNLAYCYKTGNGCEKNQKKAAELYEKASNDGHSKAMYSLAIMYESGIGCNKDHEKAHELYKKAAYLGEKNAQIKLDKWKFK